MNRKLLPLLLVVAFVGLFAVGCGSDDAASKDDAKPDKQFVTIVTGSTGGTYYPVGTIVANLWNDKLGDTGVVASAQSSQGSVENLNMLNSGEAQLGIAMSNMSYFAYQGTQAFKDNKFEKARFVTGLWPDVSQFVVTKESGIESVADLAGKRFSVGGAGGGTEYSTKMILDAVAGLSFEDVEIEYLGYSDSSGAIQNGQLDGMNAEGGVPTSAVSEITASRTPVNILEFGDEEYAKLKEKAPYYVQYTIPAGTYPSVDNEIQTVGVKSALVASADLDTDLVYNLVKTMYENLSDVKASHKALEYLSLERASTGMPPVPLHAGAVKYYKEVGIDIPDELIPPEYQG